MKDIFSVFSDMERKRLLLLLLIFGFSLVFLFLVSFRERRSFHRLEDTLVRQRAAFKTLDTERSGAAAERAR